MKNSQLAALCAVILSAALIIVGGNYMLVRGIQAHIPLGSTQTPTGRATIEPPKPPEPANTDTPPRVGDPSRQPS